MLSEIGYNLGMARNLLRLSRLTHLYFGVFIAPALIFFAFTGALQTFGVHETTRGSDYQPPRWAVVLGQIHKKQTSIVPVRRPPASPAPASGTPVAGTPSVDIAKKLPVEAAAPATVVPMRHPLPLKIFFLIVSMGLFTSTLTGLFMSYKYTRNTRLITAVLIAGTTLPIVLVFV